jgi:CRP/FNR family transcriptional regulator, cyclic AMP receptor protein
VSDATVTIRGRAAGEADFYYTLDRVLGGLLVALKGGRIDEAVDVYSRCREDIGFQLIARVQADPALFKQTANLFFRARDYARAAYCCEQLEEYAKAAQLYERCDDWAHAAQMYAAAGEGAKAAEMFEKDGDLVAAARLFKDLKETLRAASCFERAKRPFDAATLYQEAGRFEKAIELLNAVDEDSPDRKVANKVIRELMAQANLKRSGTGQIAAAAIAPAGLAAAGAGGAARTPGPVPEPILMGGGQLGEDGKGIVTVMDGFDVLKDLPLFAMLSLTELKSLYHLCEVVTVLPGQVLIRGGLAAEALFVVMDGELEVKTPAGDHVTMLGIGQHAGEMGLLDDAPAGVDVVARAPGRVLRLDRRGFQDALAGNDALALRVMKVFVRVLTERLRETTARVGR